MKTVILVVVVALAMVVLWRLLSSQRGGRSMAPVAQKPALKKTAGGVPQGQNPYRAVSVKCGPGACEPALALSKRRFLPGQLGKVPLRDCTSIDCTCKFVHFPDRRDSDGDQRAPTALRSGLYVASGKPERRSRKGRRKDDFD